MNDLIERLRLGDGTSPDHELLLEAADALEALAQPDPVKDLEDIDINITWNENSMRDFGKDELNFARAILGKAQDGYVAPQRTWVGLTAKEKHEFRYSHMTTADFIDAIEAKLKDKNTSGQE